eukprot:TRINITY_DN500_c0_g1_i3.p1 TRINITY_DN500_c0_g1~~TRINITY_DN500_c0_g1_i3.p1  ORF type:complete len:218 (-),score=47.69 TRINITY_DN500_c0_g1_i3:544-1197(-)
MSPFPSHSILPFDAPRRHVLLTEAETSSKLFQLADYICLHYPELTASGPVTKLSHVNESLVGRQIPSLKRKLELSSPLQKLPSHQVSVVPSYGNLCHSSSSDDEDGSDSESADPSKGNKKKRGNLPKSATDELKGWLHNHLNYPYPTEDEKYELVQRTSLTLCQVNNWFINARRRLLPSLKHLTNQNSPIHQSDERKSVAQVPKSTISHTLGYEQRF